MIVITLARKPLPKGQSVAATCLEFNAGGLNINGTRIYCDGGTPSKLRREVARRTGNVKISTRTAAESHALGRIERRGDPRVFMEDHSGEDLGRWPANILLDHLPGCHSLGTQQMKGSKLDHVCGGGVIFVQASSHRKGSTDDEGMETVKMWDCQEGCPTAELNRQGQTVGIGGVSSRYFKQFTPEGKDSE